jgi:hypothetical protein
MKLLKRKSADLSDGDSIREEIVCAGFNVQRRALACGTNSGKVLLWQYEGTGGDDEPASAADWLSLEALGVSDSVESVAWGPGERLLAVVTENGRSVEVFSETVVKCSMSGNTAAFLFAPLELGVERFPKAVRRHCHYLRS